MQALFQKFSFLAKIVFYPKNLFTILYCCLLIIASIITMFSFQGAFWIPLSRNSMKQLLLLLQSISWMMVESTGIEPVTSCLQGRRSPSWANPPYRRNQIHNFRFEILISKLHCVFVSPHQIKPASLGFEWSLSFSKETQWNLSYYRNFIQSL